MATIDQWHGYGGLYNITMHREGNPPYPEASGAKLLLYGPTALVMKYELSPFSGHTCHTKGEGWHRTVEEVKEQQAPYLWHDLCRYLFEILIENKITYVSEWSNFHYCLACKRYGSQFVFLPAHHKSGISQSLRFTNPDWQLEVYQGSTVKKAAQNRIDKANIALMVLKKQWQQPHNPDIMWGTYQPEHFGIRIGCDNTKEEKEDV